MANLDKYKQAIVDCYQTTNKNIFVSATAGSGKTFTLCHLAKLTPPIKTVNFLAFNKSIAEELAQRLPRTVRASTLHSCALSALRSAFKMNFVLNDAKNYNLAMERVQFPGIHRKRIPGMIVKTCILYNLMRFNLVPDDIEEVMTLGERYGCDVDEMLARKAIELRAVNDAIASDYFDNGCMGKIAMDFTDMLEYAVKYVDTQDFKQYNVVMLDECQDISPLQYAIVQKCKTPRGRLIAVGDERQSIYSFMGSNLDSLYAIKNSPNTVSLPLSMTYRCAEAIVEEACKVFPNGIEAAPGAAKGAIMEGKIQDAQEGDFILCRNNAPLIDAFITLLRQGKKCSILGKEYGDELVGLIDSVNDIYDFEVRLNNLEDKLARKGIKNPTRCEAYDKLEDKINVLISLYEYFGDLETVRAKIYDIFVENSSKGITLSTIHKSKGLEAKRVFFLKPDLLPSPYATTEMEIYAEKCLKFVAITRAKENLIYCE